MLQFFFMQNEDLPVCAQLAQTAYRAEKAVHPALPDVPDDSFLPLLADMLPEKHAYLAKEDGRIVGYLCFTGAFDGAFGNCRGVFSPLHASAFYGSQPERTRSAPSGRTPASVISSNKNNETE